MSAMAILCAYLLCFAASSCCALSSPLEPCAGRRFLMQLTSTVGVGVLSTLPAAVANPDPALTTVSTLNAGPDFTTLASGVKVKEVRVGAGPPVRVGDTVSVQYSGRCLNLNGKKFISTQDASTRTSGLAISEPYVFTVGSGAVIPGLEQAVLGMAKGGYRRVVIPAALGYDAAMRLGPTPDNFQDVRALESIVKNPNRDASLLFDVQLERIKLQR
uniref:peptidylprolyl isomerase n=1 Tax=Calcidiscus leptoporus TaxID=127549 RepID=A0A7S0IPQ2_9EUKA